MSRLLYEAHVQPARACGRVRVPRPYRAPGCAPPLNCRNQCTVTAFCGRRKRCLPDILLFFAVALDWGRKMRWCTVTVTDDEGRRHSVDVQATSSFDAAHLLVVEAEKERSAGLPKPTLATVFEVVTAGRIYHVTGTALRRWIVEKRSTWKGPQGFLFCQRPFRNELYAGYRTGASPKATKSWTCGLSCAEPAPGSGNSDRPRA